VRLVGNFRDGPLGPAYIIAIACIPLLKIQQNVESLIDTGATKTTILDRHAVTLGISYTKLSKLRQPLLGLGGFVEIYVARYKRKTKSYFYLIKYLERPASCKARYCYSNGRGPETI